MVNKPVKMSSTLLVITEMQIKTMMRCHSPPTRTARTVLFFLRKITSVGEDVEKLGPLCIAGKNVK
jgi:hypothetical protein